MQTQSGSKHVMYYKVIGVDRHANEVILGEGFRGESGANAAIRFLSQELGIRDADAITRRKRDRRGDEYANEF